MTDRVSRQPSALRLARLIKYFAVNVIQPAVVNASEAAVFYSTVAQVRASMGTIKAKKPWATQIIAKKNKVLVE
jgi:hypothetical protein